MPYSRLQWRALAVLGALLMVIFIWPLTCASMPTPPRNISDLISNKQQYHDQLPSSTSSSSSSSNKSDRVLKTNSLTTSEQYRRLMLGPVTNSTSIETHREQKRRRKNKIPKITPLDIQHFWSVHNKVPKTGTPSLPLSTVTGPNVIYSNKSVDSAAPESIKPSPVVKPTTDNHATNINSIRSSLSSRISNIEFYPNTTTTTIITRRSSSYSSSSSLPKTRNNDDDITTTTLTPRKQMIDHLDRFESGITPSTVFNAKRSSRTDRSIHSEQQQESLRKNRRRKSSPLDRNERSANLSHITGVTRKIQLYIKNHYLQLLPDGVVNGTQDEYSDFTILQRTTIDLGRIRIQSVVTCLFLCMDSCGTVYGSKDFTDDCIFNEAMEQHHYNTYSSTTHSNARRTFYLALNRHGQQRKVQIPASRPLGKLATYTKSLTETVPHDRVDKLITRIYGAEFVRNTLKQLCDTGKSIATIISTPVRPTKGKCSLRKNNQNPNSKKKKGKRKCRPDEVETGNCTKPNITQLNQNRQAQQQNRRKNPKVPKCSDEDCKKRNHQKKNNLRVKEDKEADTVVVPAKKPKQNKNVVRNKNPQFTTTPSPTTTTTPSTAVIFSTTILPETSLPPPYDDEIMYSDDPFVSSSSTEFHDDDELDDTSSFAPHHLLQPDQISQFMDDGFDDDEFDERK